MKFLKIGRHFVKL